MSRLQTDVIRAHKRDVLKAQDLVTSMLAELSATDWEEVQQTIEAEYEGKEHNKKLAEAKRATSAPTRAITIRTLASAMETLVKIERQAFAMDADKAGDDAAVPLEERLKAYALAAREAAIDGSGGRVVEFAGGKRPFPADKPL